MTDIMYDPNDVGKIITNSRGKKSIIRKYHMTEEEKVIAFNKWREETSNVDRDIIKRAGKNFYNPYRRGIYYYQIYSMFVLGANKWHSLHDIIDSLENIMSKVKVNVRKDGALVSTAWDQFRGKSSRGSAIKCKDFIGRVQENMIFFQRLNKLHPTGYKLRQVCAAVDMKRVSTIKMPDGCFYYRLSTYNNMKDAVPIRDYSRFKPVNNKHKYINYKFVGTIIPINSKIEWRPYEMS